MLKKSVCLSLLIWSLPGCTAEPEEGPETVEDASSPIGDVVSITGAGSEESPCELPIMVGPCKTAIPQFGYNQELNECLEFSYGGCDGNGNRFETIEECEALCVIPEEDDTIEDDTRQTDALEGEDIDAPDAPMDTFTEEEDTLDASETTPVDAEEEDADGESVDGELGTKDTEEEQDGETTEDDASDP